MRVTTFSSTTPIPKLNECMKPVYTTKCKRGTRLVSKVVQVAIVTAMLSLAPLQQGLGVHAIPISYQRHVLASVEDVGAVALAMAKGGRIGVPSDAETVLETARAQVITVGHGDALVLDEKAREEQVLLNSTLVDIMARITLSLSQLGKNATDHEGL
ncbi:hypothetical protein BC830DRAFT_1166938 [Chytriomyces sp. MP71]|nr:hypothetical protein BC830DRAFT_1166938 [Chytriomyces sp. MP71]